TAVAYLSPLGEDRVVITSRLCAAHFHGLRRTLSRRLRSRQRATFCRRTDGEDTAGLGRASSSGTIRLTRMDGTCCQHANQTSPAPCLSHLIPFSLFRFWPSASDPCHAARWAPCGNYLLEAPAL